MTGASIALVQSGMGGVAQAQLAAAVAEAGAIGMIGLYRHLPDEIEQMLAETAALTTRRFGVNFVSFVLSEEELSERLDVVLAHEACPLVTFFGLPWASCLRRAARHTICGVQVGSTADCEAAFEAGAHFVVLQTPAAGGHHLGHSHQDDLLRELHETRLRHRPILLAGGLSSPQAVANAMDAGFAGVLCGTIFAASAESSAHAEYKHMIVSASSGDTITTDAFSIGWHTHLHRVIRNQSCSKREPAGIIGSTTYFGKRYPILRYSVAVPVSTTEGAISQMALYCGTSCDGVSAVEPARDIVQRMAEGF